MPGHSITTQETVVYSGSVLTEEEQEGAASAQAQSLSDYVSSLGKGVLTSEGIIIQGIGNRQQAGEGKNKKD